MRLEPALTYRGALQILGKYDRPILSHLERLASTAVLGGGLLELVDPKNDAVRLLRGVLDDVHSRLLGTSGRDRLQLVAAAHTTLVVTSFFEALQANLGSDYDGLELTDTEKLRLSGGRLEQPRLDALWRAPVPIPGPRYGFRENLDERLSSFFAHLAAECTRFVSGLATDIHLVEEIVQHDAVHRYESAFVRLAADVPEFGVWLMLGESTETRREVRAWGRTVLDEAGRRLESVERLLSEAIGKKTDLPMLQVLGRINRSILERPVLDAEAHVSFPSLEHAFVTPRLRVAVADRGARPSDERWWAEQRLVTDTGLFFVGHLTSPECAVTPLLVLGLPGAGKSMLTQMLAARLPESACTAVRVPLRHVRADATVSRQIQEALDEDTHGRVQWHRLVEEAERAQTLRVVVLDGLDELMQASGASQSRYLHDVAEFQAAEAAMGRPVAVVVTSRTVMADRVQIPLGTVVVRLESFDDEQVGNWLRIWNELNNGRSGFRPLSLRDALSPALLELVRQPLLLVLIALYTADPEAPALTGNVTSAALYQRLISHFLRREALKDAATPSGRGVDVDRLVAERRWSLTVAAFAMLNRGRPYATGPELERDLGAFLGATANRQHDFQEPLDHTIRTVGRFFFVHASTTRGVHELPSTYEFLHSTFGEYLVAEHVASRLQLLSRRRADARELNAGFGEPPDPGQLRALLSHEPLLKFPRVVELVSEICDGPAVVPLLQELVAGARTQLGPWIPASYNPSGRDLVDHTAVYSLNLVSVLADVSFQVPVSSFAPSDVEVARWWRSLVRHWRSSLDDEAWLAVVGALTIRPDWVLERPASRAHLGTRPADWLTRGEARLLGDLRVDAQLSAGAAAWRGTSSDDAEVSVIFAGLVEMQLHGSLHPRVLRAAVDLDERLTPPVFDVLLTLVTRASVWLAHNHPFRDTIDRGLVLALTAAHVLRAASAGPVQFSMMYGSPPVVDVDGDGRALFEFEPDDLRILPESLVHVLDRMTEAQRVGLQLEPFTSRSTDLADPWRPEEFVFVDATLHGDRYRNESTRSAEAAVATHALRIHLPTKDEVAGWNALMSDVVALARRRLPASLRPSEDG